MNNLLYVILLLGGKMKNVVIIGAGPAGLTAAYELLKKGNHQYKVTIIEEEKQVGGISKTINYKGNRMDIGGHRFFTKENKVKKIWTELLPVQAKPSYDDKVLKIKKSLPKKGPDPETCNDVMLKRNRVSRIFYEDKFFDYPISINLKTIKNLGLIRTVECGLSYLKYKIIRKKENNLEDFYMNRFGKKLYSMFFLGYTEKVWGRKPKDISKEWGYQRVKGISISAVLKDYISKILKIKNNHKEVSLIDQFYYPKYGPGQLYEAMAKKIEDMGGRIIKNSKVIRVMQKENKIQCITYLKNGKEYSKKVDILISSMPVKDLIESMNDVDKKIYDIASHLPYRDFITVGVLVPKLSLKNTTKIKTINNNIPDCWLYVQDDQVKLGRIQIFNNWSPYMVKRIDSTVWLGLEYFCNENDSFWNLSDEELKAYAEKELRKIKVIKDKVMDSCCIRVKKAYPAYFDSYQDFDQVKNYLNHFDNLYCIGRNGQHRYNNMDHSMMTAIKCVDIIIKNKKNKKDIWNVNTDKNYHEERKNEKINR